MKEIKNEIDYIPDSWIENSNRRYVRKEFSKLFQYKIINMIYDICYTIATPFLLWKLYYRVDMILYFIINSTIKHETMGYVCKYSLFENIENKCDNYGLQNSSDTEEFDKKTYQSYLNFRKINKNWTESKLFSI